MNAPCCVLTKIGKWVARGALVVAVSLIAWVSFEFFQYTAPDVPLGVLAGLIATFSVLAIIFGMYRINTCDNTR